MGGNFKAILQVVDFFTILRYKLLSSFYSPFLLFNFSLGNPYVALFKKAPFDWA